MKTFYYILALLVVFGLGLLSRPFFFPLELPQVKSDTTYIRDTIKLPTPKPKAIIEYKDKPIYVDNFDTLRLRDTIYLTLPTHQKYYKDERYEAWVSGYKPNLDSINIFTNDKIITNNITILPKKNNLYVSAGLQFNRNLSYPISIGYMRNWKHLSFSSGLVYEPINRDIYGQFKLQLNLIKW